MANHKNHADQRSAAEMDAAQRELAYHMWERDGRPEGRSDYYWQQAGEELDRDPDDMATVAAPAKRGANAVGAAIPAAKAPSRVKAAAGKSPAEKPAARANGASASKPAQAKTAAAKAMPPAANTAEPAAKAKPARKSKPKG